MRTVEGPFCLTCGDGIRRIEVDGLLDGGRWTHIHEADDHYIVAQYRVIKES